ncbi:MAG: tripartite tricarboxylate transporter substrate-binding protein, partial [Pseudothermotoga sp.]
DVPTFRELGIDLVEKAYRGVSVPPGTPEDVKRVLEAAVKEVNNNPEFVAKMEEMGFVIENYDEAASAKLVSELMAYYKELWEETKGK